MNFLLGTFHLSTGESFRVSQEAGKQMKNAESSDDGSSTKFGPSFSWSIDQQGPNWSTVTVIIAY